jgi:hypothetical protein
MELTLPPSLPPSLPQTLAATLPLAIKNVWFEGKLRIEIDLVPEFPHAKTVLITFLEKPIIDFSVIPLKSVNIFDLPGLSQFITNLIINGICEYPPFPPSLPPSLPAFLSLPPSLPPSPASLRALPLFVSSSSRPSK